MNFLLILLALLISGIAVLSVVALGGERAVPGAAFFSGVGRDGLGTFAVWRISALSLLSSVHPKRTRHTRTHPPLSLLLRPQNLLMLTRLPLSRFAAVRFPCLMMRRAP